MKENDDDKEILAQDVFILGDTTFGACCVDEVIIIIIFIFIRIIFASIINVIKIIIIYSLAGNNQVLLDPRRRANRCTEEHHLEVPDPRRRGDCVRRTPRCSFDGGGGEEED